MKLYKDHGIDVKPMPITAGESISIEYNGLLAKSGADKVYLHTGYGSGSWDNVKDIQMRKEEGNWKTELYVDNDQRLNICFYDSARNWDNNCGKNWSFIVHNGGHY